MEWEPQNPSDPSSSSSLSNQSVSNSIGARSEKVPVLKQISPSPAVSALSKLTDDELRRKGVEDLLRILRRVEADYKSLLGEHGNIVKDVNRRLQIFVLETRSLKEVNQKLQDDNQELRDLCCFLDDDRQRGRKLAREWQRFGRYTASVMRSEVAVYQEKLRELEDKQNELITENMELKELCLFLDQERVRMTGDRDEGDGSSNGTVTGHEDGIISMENVGTMVPNSVTSMTNNYPISPSSAASYIRELELKVRLLEDEKKVLAQRVDRNSADGLDINSSFENTSANHMSATESNQSLHGLKPGTTLLRKSPVSNKPETVMHAMKVLQVHEELEKTPTEDEGLDDPEKAIVREMCNVVWRTLGDTEEIGSFNESSDSIHEPPYMSDSAGRPNVLSAQPLYGPVQTYGYTNPQLQSQTSGAVLGGLIQSNVGHQSVPGMANNFSGPISHQLHSQRQNSLRPSNESKQQQSNDPEVRSRQNSLSEKMSADRSRNFPQKQSIDKSDDRRNPEQKHFSQFMQDAGSKPSNQQQLSHIPLQQPPSPSSHQQHSIPDMGNDLYPSQRPTDQIARSTHQSSQFQQPPSVPLHQQQQILHDTNLHSHPSQRNTNLTSKSADLPHRFQQRPSPPQHPSSAFPGNQSQRSLDSQSNKQQSGHIHPQYRELPTAASLVGHPPQNQRNTQPYPHQQVKLLDAPGTGRHVQRIAPTQGQVHNRDRLREESFSHGQTRLHGRGDNAYEERNSTERDTQPHPAPRSVSSSSVLNPSNPQIFAQNQQGMKSTQNFKGPSVFRAYPPQMTSMPTQAVSLKGSQSQELSSSGNQNQHDLTRGNYSLGNQPQNKRFQEQEWRQTYLDDSDTL